MKILWYKFSCDTLTTLVLLNYKITDIIFCINGGTMIDIDVVKENVNILSKRLDSLNIDSIFIEQDV